MIFIALEISETNLVLVVSKSTGKSAEIVHAESIVRTPGDLAASLSQIPSSYRHGTLVVPRGMALLREFQIPSGSLEEIIQMVHFQMEREFPLDAHQIRSSFAIGNEEKGKVSVQVVAVPNEVLDPLLEELEKGGFKVDAVTVSTFGLARLVSDETDPVAIIGKSGQQAEILISRKGKFSVTRTAPIPRGETLEEAIKIEVDRSVLAFQARSKGSDVEKIIMPTKWDDLGLNGAITLGMGVSWDMNMASAVGVCLAGKGGVPNLLKPPAVEKKFHLKKEHRLAIIAAVLLSGIFFLSLKLVSDREAELAGLRSELKQIKPKVIHLKRMDANLKLARTWQKEGRFPWGELLKAMNQTSVSAENLYLVSATFEESGSVTVTGKVRDRKSYATFRKELEALPYLRNVEPGPLIPRGEGSYQNDFSVKAVLVRSTK